MLPVLEYHRCLVETLILCMEGALMKNQQGTLGFLYRTAGRLKWRILILLALQILIGLCGVVYALLLRNMIDAAVGGRSDVFFTAVAGFAVLVCMQMVLRAAERYLSEATRSSLENRLKEFLYTRLMERGYGSVTAVHSGEWMNRLTNDTTVVANAMTDLLPGAGGMAVRLAGALIMISILEPGFLYLILPAGVVLLLFSASFRRIMKRLHKEVQEADGHVRIFLQETLESLLVVRSYSAEQEMEKEADYKMKEHRRLRMKRSSFSVLCNCGFGILMNAAYVLGAILCGWRILSGTMSYGTFTAVLQLIGQIQSPFANLSGLMPRYYSMLASAERLLEADTLSGKQIPDVMSAAEIGRIYETEIEAIGISNGSFTYLPPAGDMTAEKYKDRMPVVFSALNLNIEKGEYVAFTGPSGCGKSTVLKLLMCLFPLDGGERYVRMSGENVVLTPAWQRLFAYVPQGNFLMSGTVREIISLADREHMWDTYRLERALRIACADSFVEELEDGVDTRLGEKGQGLSEGQMQRLAIARAVFSDCPVLLLDECTSALDSYTEKQLLINLRQVTDKTVILVTHRPEALKICDRVVTFSAQGIISDTYSK